MIGVRRLLTLILLCAAAGTAVAQGVGLPTSRWGLGFGNSPDFIGLRFNYRDARVRRVTGVNLTLWQPQQDNADALITGLSLGPIPGGGTMRGVQIGLLGVVGMQSIYGVTIATLGMGTGGDLAGVNVAGIGIGAGKRLLGLNLAGIGLGAGEVVAGVNVAVFGLGAGKDVLGITVVGIGAGAGERMIGLNLAGLGLGAGRELAGISIGGLAAGAPTVKGLTLSLGVVGGQTLMGVQIAGASVHAVRGGSLTGLAVSPFNYIKGTQTGVSIGVVNYAWSVRGLQIGVVNIVRDNPTLLKVLPVLNTSF